MNSRSTRKKTKLSLWVTFFLVSIIVPAQIEVGSLRLTPFLVVILLALPTTVWKIFFSAKIKIIAADFLLLLYASISSLTFFINHSFDHIWQYAGLHFVTTAGPYFLARTYVQSYGQFLKTLKVLFWVMACIIPFAMVEFFTGKLIINNLVSMAFKSFAWAAYEPRLGFYRVQATFEHPILYGIFASSVFSLFFLVLKGSKFPASSKAGAFISILGTVFSISSGALISIFFQVGLQAWDRFTRVLRHRWWLLFFFFVGSYIFIDIFSNRDPFVVLASFAAIDKQTAYFRLLIWGYGVDNILANPIFGIGLNDWVRPGWMPPSVDSFWLLTTMRHGLPAIVVLLCAIYLLLRKAIKPLYIDANMINAQKGYVYSILGISLSLFTVHLWGATYAFFVFLIGMGGWMGANYKQQKVNDV